MDRNELEEFLEEGGEVGAPLPDTGTGRVEWVVYSKLQPYPRPRFTGYDPNGPELAAAIAEFDAMMEDRRRRPYWGRVLELKGDALTLGLARATHRPREREIWHCSDLDEVDADLKRRGVSLQQLEPIL